MLKSYSQFCVIITIFVLMVIVLPSSSFAGNPLCYKKIEGVSLDQSVSDITKTLQQLGLHDITCKQRSKVPCAARKTQMMTFATNDQGALHKVGDKLARVTFGPAGKPKGFAYEYYTDGPSTLQAHDANRSWDGWTYQDTIESRINEYCKSPNPEGGKVGCRYASALEIKAIIGAPRDKDCQYGFSVMFSAVRGKPEAPTNHKIVESMVLAK